MQQRLGPEILPQLLHVTRDPATIPFDDLPGRFVVKPTHGSGWVAIVADKTALDKAALLEKCRAWLNSNFYDVNGEWAYKNILPRILVEEVIDDGSGTAPKDYKLFVFHGRVAFVQVDSGRFTEHRRRLFSRAWEKLEVIYEHPDIIGDVPPPRHFDEMIRAAEILGQDEAFVRADFYDTDAKLYFGELTTTPTCGLGRFHPAEFDRHFGALWKL